MTYGTAAQGSTNVAFVHSLQVSSSLQPILHCDDAFQCHWGVCSLQASIAEAAFMTGMERNSDRVAMAAFAPLLSHSRDPACPHDLVIFDNHR